MVGTRSIAIVGLSVELPSGNYSTENLDHASFFDFLLNSGNAYEDIPSNRFNIEAWKGNALGSVYPRKGAFLKDIDMFDHVEFGISSRDAQAMAPATRKLLENSFLALLDSGLDYRRKRVGVYTAGTNIEMTNVAEADELEARGSFGGYPAMIANRISNHLDLLGPSLPVDTACSSTLTAMHLAIQGIMSGDCEAAVVGGCQLNHRLIDWILYSQGSLLARDGRCKPFDISADGFSRAEGCIAVVIKPLESAIIDHDYIYATIQGSAINSTGAGAPPGAPVAEAQCDAMVQAFSRASRQPSDVDYVELHATGTAKGDPTEANWVGFHFQREDELLIGSVKGNIGHTEITAFLASLSKVVSIFQRRIIPPTINVTSLNPAIQWERYRLRVPTQVEPLPCRAKGKSLISIAGSGIGGSNGHVVLESPPCPTRLSPYCLTSPHLPALFVCGGLSNRTASEIGTHTQSLLADDRVSRAGLSTVLGRRAKQMTWRSFAIVWPDDKAPVAFPVPRYVSRDVPPLVFVFSGQGPQHKDMGRQLFNSFPTFRRSVIEMDEVVRRLTNRSIIYDHGLFAGDPPDVSDPWPISLTLPAICIFQIAMFDLFVSLGVKPDVIIGHSAGETAVLYTSGAAPKSMAVELAIIRGRCFTPIESMHGRMAAVACSPDELQSLLQQCRERGHHGIMDLACYNAQSAVAVSGEEKAIDALVTLAESKKIFARKLRTRVPIHSRMMEACKAEYVAALQDLFHRYPGAKRPTIPTYSTLTGNRLEHFDEEYYWSSTRNAVRFTQAMASINTIYPISTFVEISPHPVLGSYISSMANDASSTFPTVSRPKRGESSNEYSDILTLFGNLTTVGHNCVNFTLLNNCACYEADISFPKYPFAKKRWPLYPDTPGFLKQVAPRNGPLNHQHLKVNTKTHPSLGEHIIRGEPIMPAAGFLEMAIEFGASTLMKVNMRSILSLSSDKPISVHVRLDGAHWTVKSTPSKASSKAPVEQLHADGYLSFEPSPKYPNIDIEAIRGRCSRSTHSGFYRALSYFSNYGPQFQRVTNMYYGVNEALVSIVGLDNSLAREGNYILHPAILDACIQATAYRPFHGDFNPNVYYLPSRIDSFTVHQTLSKHLFPYHIYAHVEFQSWLQDEMSYDIALVDDNGVRLCTFKGLTVARHHFNPVVEPSTSYQVILQPTRISLRNAGFNEVVSTTPSSPLWSIPGLDILSRLGLNTPELFPVDNGCPKEPSPKNATSDALGAFVGALDHMEDGGHKVINALCVVPAHMNTMVQQIAAIVEERPSLFVNLYVNGDLTGINTRPSHGIIRSTSFPVSSENRFDVVLAFVGTEGPQTSFPCYTGCLAEGATLIISHSGSNSTSVAGGPSRLLYSWLQELREASFSVLQTFKDEFSFTVEAQIQHSTSSLSQHSLYRPDESFTFEYVYGQEADLQWEFSGLNTFQELDIWLLAKEGRDGDAAMGLVNALRKEYPAWMIRLVVFHPDFSDKTRRETLLALPVSLREEVNLIIAQDRSVSVPRIAPIEFKSRPRRSGKAPATRRTSQPLPIDHIEISIVGSFKQGSVTSFVGRVIDSNGTIFNINSYVFGLAASILSDVCIVDVISVHHLPEHLHDAVPAVCSLLPGFIIGILAPGISAFSRSTRLADLRVLVTHEESLAGLATAALYSDSRLPIVSVSETSTLLTLVSIQDGPFDVIISGYETPEHDQVLSTLLKKRGKMFNWITELDHMLAHDPCLINDALQVVISLMEDKFKKIHIPGNLQLPFNAVHAPAGGQVAAKLVKFDPAKSYILLGGIGTLGAHLALMMYQRGARHLVLTSRSGERSLDKNDNLVVRRIFDYLKEQEDLNIRLVAADAASRTAMKRLMSTVCPDNIGGCIILTGVLVDRPFKDMTESEFYTVCTAKVGVLEALKDYVYLPSLDFVVGFSSVSAVIGFPGQTNYDVANTILEAELAKIPNGFSFVCPGILDSTMMFAGADEATQVRLSRLASWSVTSEDCIKWFEDALYKFQNGSIFDRYMPSLDWEMVDRSIIMPYTGKHLVPPSQVDILIETEQDDHMEEIICSILGVSPSDFAPDVPFTAYGIDSLSASRLSFQLRNMVQVTQIQLLAHICLNDLRRMIDLDSNPSESSTSMPVASTTTYVPREPIEVMKDMVQKYIGHSPLRHILATGTPRAPAPGKTVLLTGTTGSLGSNILRSLLADQNVSKVYAFNRTMPGVGLKQRQQRAFEAQGISAELASSSKLTLLHVDLCEIDFNLDADMLSEISSSVTHIIHNAWTVDFVLPLTSYEDSLKGLNHLLQLASCAPNVPVFCFISTTGIFHGRQDNATTYLEEPSTDPNLSVATGYLESKWVGERIVRITGDKLGLPTKIIRAGVLSGSNTNGAWDSSHWVPALVCSGPYLGCLPEGDSVLSWISVDDAAGAIVELIDSEADVSHVVHPRSVPWNYVMQTISKILGVPLVPYPEWLSRLESAAAYQRDLDEPTGALSTPDAALRLLHFFRLGLKDINQEGGTESMGLLPKVNQDRAIRGSKTLRRIAQHQITINEDDVRRWLAYWGCLKVT
ncbi:hypothetical protein FA15DRAFT_756455 [Coprinopsis marcescibilis]|uniref:Polyketide synthase n=1 Tax=Coprinopsis marcescibilis TaxID=230819 RepID=A0A5C3KVX7_COPMA|nr:hypothetical protein FA15DRAFT_756455 [Coprinopsis marcescibilis]